MRITRSGHVPQRLSPSSCRHGAACSSSPSGPSTGGGGAGGGGGGGGIHRTDGHDARRRRHRHVRPARSRTDRAPRRRPRGRRAARRRHRVSAGNGRQLSRLLQSRLGPVPIALASRRPAITNTRAPAPRRTSTTSERPPVPTGLGYYSFTAGDWLILMLNSNIAADARIAAVGVRARASSSAQRTPCTMAVWHHPLFTSGPNGNNAFMRDMWALLEASRVEVVLNGHDHLYERFARQTADGTRRSGQRHPPVHRRHRRRRALHLRAGRTEFRRAHHEVRRRPLHAAGRRRSTGSSSASTARLPIAASIPAAKQVRSGLYLLRST